MGFTCWAVQNSRSEPIEPDLPPWRSFDRYITERQRRSYHQPKSQLTDAKDAVGRHLLKPPHRWNPLTSMPLPMLTVLRPPSAAPWIFPVSSAPSSERCGICCASSYAPAHPVCGSLRPCFPQRGFRSGGRIRQVVRMAPEEEKMTRRSPLDFPIVSYDLI